MDGLPHAHDPKAGENRLINTIDEIDVLKERYRQAKEYMDWFKPAWEKLSEDEQYILETFYIIKSFSAVGVVAEHFGVERSSAYKKKDRALNHLTMMLYGKA